MTDYGFASLNLLGNSGFGYTATGGNSILGYNTWETVSADDVTKMNGTSKTALFSHKALACGDYSAPGGPNTWSTEPSSDTVETDHGKNTNANTSYTQDSCLAAVGEGNFNSGFSTPHGQLIPTSFADGSVRAVPIAYNGWKCLWNWNNTTKFDAQTPP